MNHDDISYQLIHVLDKLFTDIRNWKSVLMSDEDFRLEIETLIKQVCCLVV